MLFIETMGRYQPPVFSRLRETSVCSSRDQESGHIARTSSGTLGTKSLDDKKYIALSVKLDEAGRMLGGWNGQLTKQNSPKKEGENAREVANARKPPVVVPVVVVAVDVHLRLSFQRLNVA